MSRSERRAGSRAGPPRREAAHAGVTAHLDRLRGCLATVAPQEIAAIAQRLERVAASGGLILLAGNGGSAATAAHMALDLSKSTLGRPPRERGARIRALCVSDSSPVLTAWANDCGYERAFAEQIRTVARPGDAVVLLSVSGASPSIVAAARAARAAGAEVIALTGARGRMLRRLSDLAVVVPSDDYQVVEDVHLAIGHALTGYLAGAFPRRAWRGSDGRKPALRVARPPSSRSRSGRPSP